MAQHDYVIANQSGSSFRSDLNNALSAIVSNNSGSSEPTTTYAYQWWADTTTGQLKLRDAANTAWIVVQELDGTMLMEDGTAAAPGLAFASDLDSGFYRIGVNQLGIATNGTHAVVVDASQRVGIGTTSPGRNLEIFDSSHATLSLTSGDAGQSSLFFADTDTNIGQISYFHSENAMTFRVNDGEGVRIDSSGRLLVGTTTSANVASTVGALVQTRFSGSFTNFAAIRESGPAIIAIGRANGNAAQVVSSGDEIGAIRWAGADGTDIETQAASIGCYVDGTPGSNDMPGRLVFSTTADGASSPTERMKIDRNGNVGIAVTPSGSYKLEVTGNAYINGDTRLKATYPILDNTYVLGTGSFRWSVVYAATGTINTSDANQKQDVKDLDAAELSVATAIKGLIKKFRFIDAVADKGDDARIHVGVIAQEVEQAFVDAGLDPRRYGMFCEDVLEDGTKRLGIRYDELLAFVIAAL